MRSWMIVATAVLVGCPSSPRAPRSPDDRPLRIQIARAEASRGAGVAELVELATHGDVHARVLALRGLGRIGGPEALKVLEQAVDDFDPDVVAAAMGGIGVAASLDDATVIDSPDWHKRLCTMCKLPKSTPASIAAGIEAAGRAGAASLQSLLVVSGRAPGHVADVALALGRMGRRKIALVSEARAWLVSVAAAPDRDVRYAATYALSRESEPPADDAVNAALAARVVDDDPEIRAVAIAGLARRNAIAAGRAAIEDSLRDRDWRVAVEAVRALAGEHGDDAGRDAVAAILVRRLGELAAGNDAEAHVVIEALRELQAYGARPLVATALAGTAPLGADRAAPLARGWIECLAISAIQRAAPHPDVDAIAHCNLPDHLRLPLLGELVTAGAGDITTHRAALRILLAHADARVRAAGIGALPATWKEGDDNDHQTIIQTIAAALGSPDPILAGAAADAAPAVLEASGSDAALVAAVVARAAREQDAELGSSLYAIIGKSIPKSVEICRAGLSGPPVRARAAAECLRAAGEAVPTPVIAAATPPPVDVADVIGRDLRWHLVTSRGEIVIALRPDVAPWNVATIVALTRKGFYDHLEFHRVVPDFVAQGGDPTMSGWGGPGFTTPAEPATAADGAGFVAGGIGMADAGRDTGGSQWFVMHSRAPHLDGRYTWVGAIVSGQKVADALLIGDRVERATIEVR